MHRLKIFLSYLPWLIYAFGRVRIKWSELFTSGGGLLAKLSPTLVTPMDSRPPGSSVHGFPRQEYWVELPFPFSQADLPDLRD